jgi:lipoprotein-releasing system permease protein
LAQFADTTITIVLIIMIIVAVLNLVTCLIILLEERRWSDIESTGSSNSSIQASSYTRRDHHGFGIIFGNFLLSDLLASAALWRSFIRLPKKPISSHKISKIGMVACWWWTPGLSLSVSSFDDPYHHYQKHSTGKTILFR